MSEVYFYLVSQGLEMLLVKNAAVVANVSKTQGIYGNRFDWTLLVRRKKDFHTEPTQTENCWIALLITIFLVYYTYVNVWGSAWELFFCKGATNPIKGRKWDRDEGGGNAHKKQRSTGTHGLPEFISTAHRVRMNYLSCMIHYLCHLLITHLILFYLGQICHEPRPLAITCCLME